VALGVGLILGTQLSSLALRAELRQAATDLIGSADAEVFAFSDTGFSPAMVDLVRKLPEVTTAAPVVSKRLTGLVDGRSTTFQMLGVDPEAEQKLHPFTVAKGDGLSATDKGTVLLDEKWAGDNRLGVGSKITLFTTTGPDEYTVKGLLSNTAFSQSSFGAVIFVSLAQAQKAFNLGSRVTQVSTGLHSTCEGSYDACTYGPFRQHLREQAIEEYSVRDNHAFVGGQSDPYLEIQPVLVFFALLALGIGLFLIYNNLAVTVQERRREIGLLRAAGATPGWIRNLFLLQAGILGAIGTVLGIGLGVLLAVELIGYLRGVSDQPGLAFVFDPGYTALVAVLGLVATVIMAVFPATRAMAVPPLEAIRPQGQFTVERSQRRVSLLGGGALLVGLGLLLAAFRAGLSQSGLSGSRLALTAAGTVLVFLGVVAITPVLVRPVTWVLSRPFQLVAPVETRLARNSILRRPNRSALTIAGLLVSTALVIGVSGLSQGALGAGQGWVDSIFVSDRLVVSPVHQTEAIRQDIARTKGVTATSPISFIAVKSDDRAVNLVAINPLDYAAGSRLQFLDGGGASPYTQLEGSRAVFLPTRVASARNLHVGDSIGLTGSRADLQYRVAAIVAHSLPSPAGDESVVISLSNARQDFGLDGFNILQVVTERPVPAGFDADLKGAAEKYGMQVESVADVRAGVERGLNSLLLLMSALGLTGVILGLLSVVTTILLNVSESSHELALLRAVGATRGQVRNMILAESGLFGLFGALLGTGVGLLLVAVMVRAGSSLGFQPAYVVPWNVIVGVLLVAVAGSLLAVIVPARRASRASVVGSLRYE
jgi:putative ABC transport system permease protein